MSIIGTAGWTIPASYRPQFTNIGSQLERYAARLNGVEINSSFYRSHKTKTYERWAAAVPENFRFSVKVPRTITQQHRLRNCGDLLKKFLGEISGLGDKLAVILVQLPPSLTFDSENAKVFFHEVAREHAVIACEPRHESWFTSDAEALLDQWRVVRVAADPPRAPSDGKPGGDRRLAYFRMHGTPQIYYSNYQIAALDSLAALLQKDDWCIFDNTAAFHALGNALALRKLVSK